MDGKWIALLALCLSASAVAQQAPAPDPLEPLYWGNVYQPAGMAAVRAERGVTYLRDGQSELKLDIYRRANAGTRLRPAVLFANGIGDNGPVKPKDWPIYTDWARIAATEGMIGITMEADAARIPQSIRAVFDYLQTNGAKHGIDPDRLAVFAASANATPTAQYMLGPDAVKGLKAAVLYYPNAPQGDLRKDLPVLFVAAEGDIAAPIAAGYPGLWQRVIEARAPWTITFASQQPHAFDGFADNADSRRLVQQTLAFLRTHLETPPAPPPSPYAAERRIVASLYNNDPAKSAELLRAYLQAHPNHPVATTQLGRMLTQLQRHDEAIPILENAAKLQPGHAQLFNSLGQAYTAKGRHSDAARAFQTAIDSGFRNGFAYQQLALAEHAAKRTDAAIAAFQLGIEAGLPKGTTYYNMACVQAQAGRKDQALDLLSRAIAEGFRDKGLMETDPDLASVRDDPRFAALLLRLT